MSGQEQRDPGKVSKGWIAVAFLILAVLTIGVGAVTGWLAKDPHDRFDWSVAAGAATAAGTVFLAATTAWLAYTTNRDVSATWESVSVARRDQQMREQPVVVIEQAGWAGVNSITHGDPSVQYEILFQLQLRNVGLGPAINVRIEAECRVAITLAHPPPARQEQVVPVIPPGPHDRPILFRWHTTEDNPSRIQAKLDADRRGVMLSGSFTDRRRETDEPVVDLTGHGEQS
jgi:hypothetical protein